MVGISISTFLRGAAGQLGVESSTDFDNTYDSGSQLSTSHQPVNALNATNPLATMYFCLITVVDCEVELQREFSAKSAATTVVRVSLFNPLMVSHSQSVSASREFL